MHAKRREKGWRDALQRARHQAARRLDRPRRLHGERRLPVDEAAARRVRPSIDAVFAANDPSAIGAMKAIWEAGLRVPRRHRGRRRRRHRARRSAARAARPRSAGRAAIRGGTPRSCCSNGLDDDDDAEPQRIIIPPRLIVAGVVRERLGENARRLPSVVAASLSLVARIAASSALPDAARVGSAFVASARAARPST